MGATRTLDVPGAGGQRRVTGSRRRSAWVAGALALTLVVTGCQNLPRRTAGTRCARVGEYAHDGTWVLKCGTKRRWARFITIDDVNRQFGDWLRAQAAVTPTTTAPPPPPPPPISTFGQVTGLPVGRGPNALLPGMYLTTPPADAYCEISHSDGRAVTGDRVAVGGPMFFEVRDAGGYVSTDGPCTWSLAPPEAVGVRADGNAGYRVGIELPPGRYVAPGAARSAKCYWETSTSADGSVGAITDISYSRGPQVAVVKPTDRLFVSSGCGMWTLQQTLPDKFVELVSSPSNWVFQGLRTYLQGGQVTFNRYPGLGQVQWVFDNFRLTLTKPVDQPFSEGTFDVADLATSSEPGLDTGGEGRSCTTFGTATIANLHLDADGLPDSADVIISASCPGPTWNGPFAIWLRIRPGA